MDRLLPTSRRLALYTAASSRLIEQAGPPGLMERAGLAVAKLALALRRSSGPVWVVCGPGNNGGDGLVAARHLHAAGVPVQVQLLADPTRLPPDAAKALARSTHLPRTNTPPAAPSLVIDALLGLGLNRAPTPELVTLIEHIHHQTAPVLAVDLPSGLHAETGQPVGDVAVRASHTLALLTVKPGLLTGEGRAHTGILWFDDLGVRPQVAADAWLLGDDALLDLRRPATRHKGSHGQVLVVGGAAGMQGAARLAARAALGSGAGRVYLDSGDSAQAGADPATPEVMVWTGSRPTLREVVGVVGCGGGSAIAARLPLLLDELPRAILDADALNALAADPALQAQLRRRHAQASTVLTPHPLEAARLLGTDVRSVQADRWAAARELSKQLACTVVLKGSGTVIASPDGTPAFSGAGGPALATGGTGDVLAGWIGGLWAQRPELPAHTVACAGVEAHGRAGEVSHPLRASELIDRLRDGVQL